MLDQEPVQKLLWFSRGYYTVSAEDGDLYFNDLRFGRSDSWLTSSGSYVFSFRLLPNPGDPGKIADFRQRSPGFSDRDQVLHLLWKRIWRGRTGEPPPDRAPPPGSAAGSGANTELTSGRHPD